MSSTSSKSPSSTNRKFCAEDDVAGAMVVVVYDRSESKINDRNRGRKRQLIQMIQLGSVPRTPATVQSRRSMSAKGAGAGCEKKIYNGTKSEARIAILPTLAVFSNVLRNGASCGRTCYSRTDLTFSRRKCRRIPPSPPNQNYARNFVIADVTTKGNFHRNGCTGNFHRNGCKRNFDSQRM